MRPLNKLPYDEVSPVIKALGNAGFDERVAADIRRNKREAAEMMALYYLHKGWYLTPPEDQVRIMQEANKELSLGIPEHFFNMVKLNQPDPAQLTDDVGKRSDDGRKGSGWTLKNAPVLLPIWNEPNEVRMAKTIKAMYRFFRWRLASVCPCVTPEENEAVDGELKWTGGKAGDRLGWAVMDLTPFDHDHVEEADGRSLENSSPLYAKQLGLAALASAAMHPIWVLAMDGFNIPHIRIMGSGVTSPRVVWIRMYIMGSCGRLKKEVVVDTHDASESNHEFKVPKILLYPQPGGGF
jgi:hypothetical protein